MPLVSKSFSDIITFTRASSGTYFDATGTLQTATTNTARFDYNPSTLAARGMLVEEQRTNLLTYSAQFDNANWGPTFGTVTANSTLSPEGTLSADKGVTNGTQFQVAQSATVSSGATVTGSCFFKASELGEAEIVILASNNTTPYGRATFNVSTGAISVAATAENGGTNASAVILSVGNGWYRCAVTVTLPAVTAIAMRISAAGVTGGLFLWGAQLEAGAFATSYIATTTASATRSADVASVNTLSPWYNASAGTLYAEILRQTTTGYPGRARFSDGTSNNTIDLIYDAASNSSTYEIKSGGTSSVLIFGGGGALNTVVKAAAAWETNNAAVVYDANVQGTDTSVVVPSGINQLRLGNALTGYIRRITYYPRRLSNAELQGITT